MPDVPQKCTGAPQKVDWLLLELRLEYWHSVPHLLVGTAILVLRAEQTQLSIVTIRKCDFPGCRQVIGSSGDIVLLCREQV